MPENNNTDATIDKANGTNGKSKSVTGTMTSGVKEFLTAPSFIPKVPVWGLIAGAGAAWIFFNRRR